MDCRGILKIETTAAIVMNVISLGLVGTEPNQELVVAQQLAPAMNSASGLAMSVEPEGGSPQRDSNRSTSSRGSRR